MNCTAKMRTHLPPQPELFSLFEEEPGGSRPPCLGEPPGPQERVQQHTLEQLAQFAPVVQILDVPVQLVALGEMKDRILQQIEEQTFVEHRAGDCSAQDLQPCPTCCSWPTAACSYATCGAVVGSASPLFLVTASLNRRWERRRRRLARWWHIGTTIMASGSSVLDHVSTGGCGAQTTDSGNFRGRESPPAQGGI